MYTPTPIHKRKREEDRKEKRCMSSIFRKKDPHARGRTNEPLYTSLYIELLASSLEQVKSVTQSPSWVLSFTLSIRQEVKANPRLSSHSLLHQRLSIQANSDFVLLSLSTYDWSNFDHERMNKVRWAGTQSEENEWKREQIRRLNLPRVHFLTHLLHLPWKWIWSA